MTDQKMRSLDTGRGNRTGIRLDVTTWEAVDWIAEQKGKKWSEWVRDLLQEQPDAINATALIRNAVADALLFEATAKERGPDLSAMQNNPLTRDSAALSDEQLDDILKGATVQGQSDFGGFVVMFGHDEHGQNCIWVKNGLRVGLHFAFIIPTGKK